MTRTIFRQEGVRGFYRGLSATLARECPGYGFFFAAYETSRSLFVKGDETKRDIGRKYFFLSVNN